MELVKEPIEKIAQWQEEHANAPNNPPKMSYLDQCFLFSYEKCKERVEALEEKACNMVWICDGIHLIVMKIIKEHNLPPITKYENHVLAYQCVGKLKEDSHKLIIEIQTMTKLTKDVVEKLIVALAKEVTRINEFNLKMKLKKP